MTAQISISKEVIRSDDDMLLKIFDRSRMTIEKCLSTAEMNQPASLLSIHRLIEAGYLSVVVSDYPWGVEFEIQRTEKKPPAHVLQSRRD